MTKRPLAIGDAVRVVLPAPEFCCDKNGLPDYVVGDTAVIRSVRHVLGSPLYVVTWTSSRGGAYEPTRCDLFLPAELEQVED